MNQSVPPTFPPGHFSGLDSVHVHVDVGGQGGFIHSIIEWLNDERWDTKINSILKFTDGPQRRASPEAYAPHTPELNGREQLFYFSTSLFGSYTETKARLRPLLERISREPGIVVEVERVIGKVGAETEWTRTAVQEYPLIYSSDTGFKRESSWPIEVHYACDIAKTSRWDESPPISPEQLRDACVELGINVGGWFLFEKGDQWAYRSNMFAKYIAPTEIKKDRDRLSVRLRELGLNCEIRGLVEQTLGLWKTPLERYDEVKSLAELAEWEGRYPGLKEFWVIAPNFLGDKSDEIQQAMISNLKRKVRYKYFLRSLADFQRLQKFAEEKLKNPVKWLVDIYDHIEAVLLVKGTPGQIGESFCFDRNFFVANPTLPDREGYRLIESNEFPGQVDGGEEASAEEIGEIVDLLGPLVQGPPAIQGLRLSLYPETRAELHRAVLFTSLENATQERIRLGESIWEQVLREYDLIVATEASQHEGEVVRSTSDGYLLVFEKSCNALRCSQRLQEAIRECNSKQPGSKDLTIPEQRIALDFGPIYRVRRAYGLDYAGRTLVRCERVLREMKSGMVCITNDCLASARGDFRADQIERKIGAGFPGSLKEFNDAVQLHYFRYEIPW